MPEPGALSYPQINTFLATVIIGILGGKKVVQFVINRRNNEGGEGNKNPIVTKKFCEERHRGIDEKFDFIKEEIKDIKGDVKSLVNIANRLERRS